MKAACSVGGFSEMDGTDDGIGDEASSSDPSNWGIRSSTSSDGGGRGISGKDGLGTVHGGERNGDGKESSLFSDNDNKFSTRLSSITIRLSEERSADGVIIEVAVGTEVESVVREVVGMDWTSGV